ncbi:MAG: hypothetical protein EOO99_09200 [Pedobacter sp.]|nr:MAG: hypothetical protein EOO99_09200 [Pedobacter sp.]
MYKIILCFSFLLLTKSISAQDSLAYTVQKERIKAILNQRTHKFGEYDLSLKSKTGIFGLQTKKDIRKSNEILREIILFDQEVFKELNTLLEYKDIQYQAVQQNSTFNDNRIGNYRQTINTLQNQKSELEKEIEKIEKKNDNYFLMLMVLLTIFLIYFIFSIKNKIPKFNKTS